MNFSNRGTLKEVWKQREELKLLPKSQVVAELETFMARVSEKDADPKFIKFTIQSIKNAIEYTSMVNKPSDLELVTLNWIQLVNSEIDSHKRQMLLMIGSIILTIDV